MLNPGIKVNDLTVHIIIPVLTRLGMYSHQARMLMLGTAAVESRMGYSLVQVGGIALGPYQMEGSTHDSLWENYLAYHQTYANELRDIAGVFNSWPDATVMIHNLWYATAMARIKYWRSSFAWPTDIHDIEGLGHIWKTHYNTEGGKGTVEKFVERYNRYVR